jgi:hypothetical protein
VANPDSLATSENTALSISASTVLANDTDPDGDPLTVTGVRNPVNGAATFSAQTNTITFTPTPGYTGAASFTYDISDGRGGTASATAGVTVTPPGLFSSSATPAILSTGETSPVELGVEFQTSTAGTISGIEFYKGAQETGTHDVHLWTSTGSLLGTATATNESASGWQAVTFANPIAVTPGTTYVASYHSNGDYAVSENYFTANVVNGPLQAPAAQNGVYAYGGSGSFPTSTFNISNDWVDVMFNPQTGA